MPDYRKSPYVGITGFMTPGEIKVLLTSFPPLKYHLLMCGVLMSECTLVGYKNKYPNRYPHHRDIADIFVDDPRVLNLVHYATDHPEKLSRQLFEIAELAGPRCHGLQVNVPWPPITELEWYWNANPEKALVLQIGSKALLHTKSPEDLVERVSEYLPMISGVLLDGSGGTGKALDPVLSLQYLQALHIIPNLVVGVAGGLGPGTMHLVVDLAERFPRLSIDAESRLRILGDDQLSIGAAAMYLKIAGDIFPH